jgi:hypothetical protein
VGDDSSGGTIQTVILHWDGASWQQTPSPDPSSSQNHLTGVAADSAGDAWAVGYDTNQGNQLQTLIVHWNGSSWQQVPSPDPGGAAHKNFLLGVTAISPSSAWAVGTYFKGTYFHTLILHWNGTSWRQVTGNASRSGALFGVDAAPGHLWAAGVYNFTARHPPLIDERKDSRWVRTTLPGNGLLAGVSGSSPSSAWAVGTGGLGSVVFHWAGSSWQEVPSPQPGDFNSLDSVAAISAANAWAAGDWYGSNADHTFLIHWDGSAWSQVPSPDPGGFASLRAVAASSPTSAWAVGDYMSTGHLHALILRCH